jgi:hypothetical protein
MIIIIIITYVQTDYELYEASCFHGGEFRLWSSGM